jgi:hypothetical protein
MSLELAYVDPSEVSDITTGRLGLQRKMRELNTFIRSLMADVQARTGEIASYPDGTAFIRNFAAFQGEWIEWSRGHDSDFEAWITTVFGGAQPALRSFINRYNGFERQYRDLLGAPPSIPGSYDPSRPPTNWLMVLGFAAVGTAALFGMAWLLREGRGVAHEARVFLPPTSSPSSRRGVAGLSASLLPSLTR